MVPLDKAMTSSYWQLLSLSLRGRKSDTDLRTYAVRSTHPSDCWASCYLFTYLQPVQYVGRVIKAWGSD